MANHNLKNLSVVSRLLLSLLLAFGLSSNLHAQTKALVIPAKDVLGYSFDWLAGGGRADTFPAEVVVYSLGCGKCTDALAAIASGYQPAPDRFMLAAFHSRDRAVSIPLIAYGLAEGDPKARRSTFLELLRIFTIDPDHYRNNPSDWETTVAARWPGGVDFEEDTIPRAFAANMLDMQGRILALADKLAVPNAIPMDRPTAALEVERGSDRYNAMVAMLSLSWMRPELNDAEAAKNIVKRARSIDPLKALTRPEWVELKKWTNKGGYWIWGGRLGGDTLGDIVDWQAQFLLLPDDASRLARHNRWFDDAITRAENGPLTPMEAFGIADIDALASPAWGAAQADAEMQLIFGSYLGSLTVDKAE